MTVCTLYGRRYRVTGRDLQGLVTADFEANDGTWRTLINGNRLGQLTVLLDGTLPANVPDSSTHAAVVARLQDQVRDGKGRVHA